MELGNIRLARNGVNRDLSAEGGTTRVITVRGPGTKLVAHNERPTLRTHLLELVPLSERRR